ncbi:MAG: 30S ribosomal protein S17 [Candidatus Omnitrophica bacterium]|nr:30S ribosomal protein S17 [Candidatus Omnitrophota bacterium]
MSKGKVLEGVVTADKSDKTITVMVKIKVAHKMYKRAKLSRKKYKVHDENNQAKIGNRVKIIESRPVSKHKRFRLLEITQ